MQLKCSRYIFNYTSAPDIVEDFILRSDDLASQTYGRDKHFSRINQVLEQARFLGWPLPRFGAELPEELSEIPPAGVDHIFENQSKLLVDVAPTTQVLLDSGKYCPVKMLPGTTAAGDLVWRLHLLLDTEGTPYIQRNRKKFKVKTKGTKIVCQTETLSYDESYVFECFGGDEGVFPVPFLPEFFSDRTIAHKFSPEAGIIEVVYIHEESPVKVLANSIVPWYRPLEINYTKALASGGEEFDNDVTSLISGWNELKEDRSHDVNENEIQENKIKSREPESLETELDEQGDSIEFEPISLTNIMTTFTTIEQKNLEEAEKILSKLGITSKAEAIQLRDDSEHKERAEKWLLAAVNRLRIIANSSARIGAVVDVVSKNQTKPVIVIQPRQKWATKLENLLNERGVKSILYQAEKSKGFIRRIAQDNINVIVTTELDETLLEAAARNYPVILISVSSTGVPKWLNLLGSDLSDDIVQIYTLCSKEIGYDDPNYISENEYCEINIENYEGPSLDILKLTAEEATPIVTEITDNPTSDMTKETETIVAVEVKNVESAKDEESKEKKVKPKFKIKTVGQTQGRPKTAATYEKALELAKKQEDEGKKCEIYGPDNEGAVYISGIGELNK